MSDDTVERAADLLDRNFRASWPNRLCVADLESATLEWVDWFNNRRLLRAIGYMPPAEYENSSYSSQVHALAGTQQTESL